MDIYEALSLTNNIISLGVALPELIPLLVYLNQWQLNNASQPETEKCQPIDPLCLSGEGFTLFWDKGPQLLRGLYLPIDEQEKTGCHSLNNEGLLEQCGRGFRLTGQGKATLEAMSC